MVNLWIGGHLESLCKFRLLCDKIIWKRYEMLCGISPFQNRERSNQKTFNAILHNEVTINPNLNLSSESRDLVAKVYLFRNNYYKSFKLLIKNPEQRLGYNGANEIKGHKWFADVDWKSYAEKKVNIFLL